MPAIGFTIETIRQNTIDNIVICSVCYEKLI